MSPEIEASFSSAAICSSARLRSRRTACASSWLFQKSGRATRASRDFRRSRYCGASKKAPHEGDAGLQKFITVLQIFKNHSARQSLATFSSTLFLVTFRFVGSLGGHFYFLWLPANHQQNSGNQHAEPSEPIAETRVDGLVGAKIVRQIRCGPHIPRQGAEDASVGIDGSGDAVVRGAHDPAAVFDGANARHAQMLLRGGGVAEPAVIRNVHEELGAIGGETADFSGIDGFVANKHAERIAVGKMRDGIGFSLAKAAHFAGNVGYYAMDERKRLVFAEGNEVHFIVGKNAVALRAEHQRAVVGDHGRVRRAARRNRFLLPLHHSDDERIMEPNRQIRSEDRKAAVLKRKRGRSLGPNQ